MSKKKTTYYGWKNVPVGVLVKSKNAFDKNVREFYLKHEDGFFQAYIPSTEREFCGPLSFDPDMYTTGKYVEVR